MAEILITGATGFVGSHLVEALGRRGLRARALVRESSDTARLEEHGVERVVGDLTDPASLQSAVGHADTVLHLAAATRALRPETFHAVNAEGTRRLAEAMESAGGGRRLVYLSSLAAVGPAAEEPVAPDTEPRPVTEYGRSKLAGEAAVLGRPGLSAAVLRAPAVYGPRDRDLLTFFKLAKYRVLPRVGSRDRPLQLVHVADLAESIVRAAETPSATGIFHIADPVAYRWDQVLDLVSEAVGRRGLKVPVPGMVLAAAASLTERWSRWRGEAAIFDRDKAREILAPGWTCETERASRELGFEAAIPLPRGLAETAAWYRAYDWL